MIEKLKIIPNKTIKKILLLVSIILIVIAISSFFITAYFDENQNHRMRKPFIKLI